MFEKKVTIVSDSGMHARPAAMFVKLANRFPCDISVSKEGQTINAKSIMGLMMLALSYADKIVIRAEGEHELQAVNELTDLIEQKFSREDLL